MAWRLVVQPNGLLAKFSDVVDDFTAYDMTEEEATDLIVEEAKKEALKLAAYKINSAKENPLRFEEDLDMVLAIHGKRVADKRREDLSA